MEDSLYEDKVLQLTASAAQPTIDELYRAVMPWLGAYVRSCFPRVCPSLIEDAAQEAFVCALEHPDRFERAHAEGGMARVEGLCRTIAWRAARGRLARHSTRFEVGGDALQQSAARREPGQEIVADVRMRLDAMLDAAVQRHAPACPTEVRAAVIDRVLSGETDTAVARRHGVRREYLNRVRREVQRGLLGAA